MSNASQTCYLLDSDAIIHAAKWYYHPDLTQAFWDALGGSIQNGSVRILKIVADELLTGSDSFEAQWIQQYESCFVDQKQADVGEQLTLIYDFLNEPVFKRGIADKWDLSKNADPWLVAFGRAYGWTVVTSESYSGEPGKGGHLAKAKIPYVCHHLGVSCTNMFHMPHDLHIVVDSGLRP